MPKIGASYSYLREERFNDKRNTGVLTKRTEKLMSPHTVMGKTKNVWVWMWTKFCSGVCSALLLMILLFLTVSFAQRKRNKKQEDRLVENMLWKERSVDLRLLQRFLCPKYAFPFSNIVIIVKVFKRFFLFQSWRV